VRARPRAAQRPLGEPVGEALVARRARAGLDQLRLARVIAALAAARHQLVQPPRAHGSRAPRRRDAELVQHDHPPLARRRGQVTAPGRRSAGRGRPLPCPPPACTPTDTMPWIKADQPAHGAVGVRDTVAVRPPATGADRALEPHAGQAHGRRDRRGLKLDLTAAGQPDPAARGERELVVVLAVSERVEREIARAGLREQPRSSPTNEAPNSYTTSQDLTPDQASRGIPRPSPPVSRDCGSGGFRPRFRRNLTPCLGRAYAARALRRAA
jgi:hypothetical protein